LIDANFISLLFAAKAGAPGNLMIDDVGPNSMALSWTKPWNDGGAPIKGEKSQ
jgi:hypothetical protein